MHLVYDDLLVKSRYIRGSPRLTTLTGAFGSFRKLEKLWVYQNCKWYSFYIGNVLQVCNWWATPVLYFLMWYTCVVKTGVPQQFMQTGVWLVCNRCVIGKKSLIISIVTWSLYILCHTYMADIFSFGISVCIHQLHTCATLSAFSWKTDLCVCTPVAYLLNWCAIPVAHLSYNIIQFILTLSL